MYLLPPRRAMQACVVCVSGKGLADQGIHSYYGQTGIWANSYGCVPCTIESYVRMRRPEQALHCIRQGAVAENCLRAAGGRRARVEVASTHSPIHEPACAADVNSQHAGCVGLVVVPHGPDLKHPRALKACILSARGVQGCSLNHETTRVCLDGVSFMKKLSRHSNGTGDLGMG